MGLSGAIIERARELVSSGSKREGVAAASAVTAAARALEDLGSQLLAIETENHVRKKGGRGNECLACFVPTAFDFVIIVFLKNNSNGNFLKILYVVKQT